MRDTFLIKKPWITDKTVALNKIGKYVFIVKPSATKNEVKKAVQEIYGVHAAAVQMINHPAKTKRFRNIEGSRGNYKKAIVTLKSGQTIDLGR